MLLANDADVLRPDGNLASECERRLRQLIHDYDASLDNAFEVGASLVSFGEKTVFHLRDIDSWNPSLIILSGVTSDGRPVTLIQHVSQISVLLTRLPRADPTAPKQLFGFSAELPSEP